MPGDTAPYDAYQQTVSLLKILYGAGRVCYNGGGVMILPLKDRILEALAAAQGADVSGEQLAKALGVTRAAVCKAVAALRAEGCEISAATNRGYSLIKRPDVLNAREIMRLAAAGHEQADVLCFDELDSTNLEARRRAAGLTSPLLIVADSQTKGRGRSTHTFYSPVGTGLYMTLAYPVRMPLMDAALCTQAVAVAVARAIERTNGVKTRIKWVNDLFYAEKKVCGILTEAISDMETGETTCLLIGVGINLTTADFPKEVAAIAGGIGAVRRDALCARFLLEALPLLRALPDAGWMDEYRQKCLTLGRNVTFEKDGETVEAFAEDVDRAGRLIVQTKNGARLTLLGGEVSVRPL